MNHEAKLARAIEDLTSRGVRRTTAAPPLFVLAWKLGWQLPPPHFLGFGALTAMLGIPFGVFYGALMWVFMWHRQSMPFGLALVLACFSGVLFGVSMAVYFRWKARRLGLPSWSDYDEKKG